VVLRKEERQLEENEWKENFKQEQTLIGKRTAKLKTPKLG
jgi:hypothetical protein